MDNVHFNVKILEKKMAGGGWSCPHEVNGLCSKINNIRCNPGMKGCELYGRYVFFDDSKNERLRQKKARSKEVLPGDLPEHSD